jgi:hypothetical protein
LESYDSVLELDPKMTLDEARTLLDKKKKANRAAEQEFTRRIKDMQDTRDGAIVRRMATASDTNDESAGAGQPSKKRRTDHGATTASRTAAASSSSSASASSTAAAAAAPKAAESKTAPKICKGKTSKQEPCKRVVSTGDYCCKHKPPPVLPGQQLICAASAEQQPPAPEQSQAPGAAGSADQQLTTDAFIDDPEEMVQFEFTEFFEVCARCDKAMPRSGRPMCSECFSALTRMTDKCKRCHNWKHGGRSSLCEKHTEMLEALWAKARGQAPASDELAQAPGAAASAEQQIDDSDDDMPPASGELAQAPGAAAAAGKTPASPETPGSQQQQTTDDDEQPLAAPPEGSNSGKVETPGLQQQQQPTTDDEQRMTNDDSAPRAAAAAETNENKGVLERFYASMEKIESENFLYRLCDVWKVNRAPLSEMDDEILESDRAGAYRGLINDWMTSRIERDGLKYPSHIGIILADKNLPLSLEGFYKQEETCRECARVRAKWIRTGRTMSAYLCTGHMLGACFVGADFMQYQF